MKARKQVNGRLDPHAEWYHRTKIAALRAEGERLRHELRRHGLDPVAVLLEMQQSRQTSERN